MSSSSLPRQRSFFDRARQVLLFELGGFVLISPPFMWLSGVPPLDSLGLIAIMALMAAVWNAVYNTLFDRLEGRLTGRRADQRPWLMRVLHAAGFEGGLVLMTLPLVVMWTGMGWLAALLADIGLALAYMAYAFVFNVAYDRFFPIPAGAPAQT